MKKYAYGMFVNKKKLSENEIEDLKILVSEVFNAEMIKKYGTFGVFYFAENKDVLFGFDYSEELPFLFVEVINNEEDMKDYIFKGFTNIIQTYEQDTFFNKEKQLLNMVYK